MARKFTASSIFAHYFLIGLAGTALIVLAAVGIKINATWAALERTRVLLDSGRPAQAIGELEAIRRTAELYPRLRVEMECLTVQCLARLGDFERAERLANSIRERRVRGGGLPATIWEAILSIPDPLANTILAHHVARDLTPESGCLILQRERALASAKRYPRRPDDAAGGVATVTPGAIPAAPVNGPRPLPDATPGWGVAAAAATRVYDLSGKFLRSVEPGTLFEIEAVKPSSVGGMALCPAMRPGSLGAPVLVRVSELNMHPGRLADIARRELDLRAQRARLQAAVQEALRQPNPANPHARKYEDIKAEHAAYWKKVKDLQRKRDSASDDDLVDYADQLRRMKGEDIRLGQALADAKRAFDEWNAEHPNSAASNPRLRELESEMVSIDRQLDTL